MKAVERRHLIPFILVTSLFALWGLANNMSDTLLAAFKRIMQMSDTQTSFIQLAFYGAYFCLALPAALFIRRFSYKSGLILGLCLYAGGALLFWPAAHVESYAFYLIAIYILASGCSVLETAANPFIMSMGSAETATRRLNIAQSFNPIGSIMGILVSKYFILQDISLYSISGTYAAVGLVLLGIMVISAFAIKSDPVKLMDESQLHVEHDKSPNPEPSTGSVIRRLLRNRVYTWGVVAQFFYVGAQICIWSFTIRLVMKELDCVEAQAATVYLVSIIGYCISRFVYTWLMRFIQPVRLLLTDGRTAVTALVFISVFMSLMFPTIYGIALGSLNDNGIEKGDVKIGASGLIMSILGGALLPPLQGMISDATGSINFSYLVPMCCFLVVLCFALFNYKR